MSTPAEAPAVSHGRGGAGNINPDDTQYVDGEVTRTGAEGSHADGAYSTGRGGAANIGDAGTKAAVRADKDVIPEAATRPSADVDHHVGRGGAGNANVVEKKESAAATGEYPKSLADKLKSKIMGVLGKK